MMGRLSCYIMLVWLEDVGRSISMHTLHEISGCLLRLSVMHPCCQVAIVAWTHFCDQTRHLFVCFYQIHTMKDDARSQGLSQTVYCTELPETPGYSCIIADVS